MLSSIHPPLSQPQEFFAVAFFLGKIMFRVSWGGSKGGEKGEISAELRGREKDLAPLYFFVRRRVSKEEGEERGGLALGREPWLGR